MEPETYLWARLLTSYWLGLSHMATHSCKGNSLVKCQEGEGNMAFGEQ